MQISLHSKNIYKQDFRYTNFRMTDKYSKKIKFSLKATTETCANLLSRTLYSRRFFPYYTFNLLAGLDENDNGVVFGYDAIGSYDKMQYGVQGSA